MIVRSDILYKRPSCHVKPRRPAPEVVSDDSQGLLMADGKILGQDGGAGTKPPTPGSGPGLFLGYWFILCS